MHLNTSLLSNTMATKANKKEPQPEGDYDTAETKRPFASYAEAVKERKEIDAQMKILNARRKIAEKECDFYNSKAEKASKKGRKGKREPNPNRVLSGIEKEIPMPPKFYTFLSTAIKAKKFFPEVLTQLNELDFTKDSLIPRNLITRLVYDYVKKNELYKDNGVDKINKTFMVFDDALTKLFSVVEGDPELTFKTVTTYIKRFIPPKEPEEKATKKTKKITKKSNVVEEEEVVEDEEEEEEEDEEEEEEEEEVVVTKKTAKKTTKKVAKKTSKSAKLVK